MFIEEVLTGQLSQFINEEDYNIIFKSLNKLYGTCMMPYPDYKKAVATIVNSPTARFRVTENTILRTSEMSYLRIMS
jgi:hypothetical protein